MKISSKGRYALRIMVDIATDDKEYVSVAEIANRQEISVKYLERIVSMLVKAGLLESARGWLGGYKLIKSPKDISVASILNVTGDMPDFAPCLNKDCPRKDKCSTVHCYEALDELVSSFLQKLTLQNIIDKTF